MKKEDLLRAPKSVKRNLNAEEFKTLFRGATLRTKKDFIEVRRWLLLDMDSPLRGWRGYHVHGVDDSTD